MAIVSRESILSLIISYNPWWQTGVVPDKFLKDFKRAGYYSCKKALHSDIRRMVVMSGARRTGKTTIIYQTISDLLAEGVKPQNILFFTFDHPSIRAVGMDQVLNIYKENISNEEEFYLFVDEIQYDKEWTHYLKMAYDMNPEMKAIATGSASSAVELGVRESGAGRWTKINIPTLTFYEYCKIKGIAPDISCDDVFKLHTLPLTEQTRIITGLSSLQVPLMHYLKSGGFPELVNTEDVEYAQSLIREDVMERAIKHDLPNIYEIRSVEELEKVFVYLCYNSSNVINLDAMSKEFEGVSKPTIEKYIGYLADANLIYKSPQLNIAGKKVLKSKNKIYIADSGMRGAVVLEADILTNAAELGYSLETATYMHVWDYFTSINKLYQVGYIRDGGGAEIDVVVQYSGKPIQYVEAKMRNNSKVADTDGIVIYGMNDTPGYVISKNATDFGLVTRKETSLYRIPAFAFLYLIGKNREENAKSTISDMFKD